MLSCKDVTDQANAYIDDELPFIQRLRVRLHLFICMNCRLYMKQMHLTIKTLGRLKKPEPVSEERCHHLVECLKKEHQSQK